MTDIDDLIQNIKDELSHIDTVSLLIRVNKALRGLDEDGNYIFNKPDFEKREIFKQPLKQYMYMIGLLISTDYIENNNKINENQFNRLKEKITIVTDWYIENYRQYLNGMDKINIDQSKQTIATFDEFMSFHYEISMRYPEQTFVYLSKIFIDKDEVLINKYGLSIKDFLNFYLYFDIQISKGMYVNNEVWNKIISITDNLRNLNTYEDLINIILKKFGETRKFLPSNESFFSINDIKNRFGEDTAQKLLNLFVVKRKKDSFKYFTTSSDFSRKPLVQIDNDKIYVVSTQWFIDALYQKLLSDLKNNDIIRKQKKKVSENLVIDTFKKILGNKAEFFPNVIEPDGQNEYDLFIKYGNFLLNVEVKSGLPREPMYNPGKSISKQYKKFKGTILKANEQNKKAKLFVKNSALYGHKPYFIPIIITFEKFGSHNSYFRLERVGLLFPWVCYFADLDNLRVMFKYLNLTGNDLIIYILFRAAYQDRMHVDDELILFEQFFDGRINQYNFNEYVNISGQTKTLIDYIYYNMSGLPYEYNSKLIKK